MPRSKNDKQIEQGHLSALLKVSLALGASLELGDVLQTAVEAGVGVLGLDTGAIYTLEGDVLALGAATPRLPADFPDELRHARVAGHPHIVAALEEGRPVVVNDVSKESLTDEEAGAVRARNIESLLYVPLLVGDRAEGVMIVGSFTGPRMYSADEIDLCRTLSAQIALAIANAQLFESVQLAAAEIRCAYDATLEGWSLALELRDEETSGHTERSAALAVELAEKLGVPEWQLAHVRRGALLHDIGKMAVPDAILRKPGSLTEDEWAVMRRHPEYARKFLSQIEYLEPAMDIPYSHHERWNGTGYPQGLRGEDIPLAARIFAVIDVFDALTSDRPYRKAWSKDEALSHIRLQAGIHFDPAVVAAFLERVGPTRH